MVKKLLHSLVKNSISLVNEFNPSIRLQNQCQSHKIIQILSNITQKYKQLNIHEPLNKRSIGIRNIYEHPSLRLTLYYLNKGSIMKLHDHNKMYVTSKILYGKMQASLYKLKQKNIYDKVTKIYEANNQGIFYIQAHSNSFNLHEFKAIQQTCFLDIIFPDYHSNNQCHFYQEVSEVNHNMVILQKVQYDDIMFENV